METINKLSRSDEQVQVNVLMKVNAKLGGMNFELEGGSTGGFIETEQPMFFGADLAHQPNKPSIVSVVASMSSNTTRFEDVLTVQGLKEPEKGAPGAFLSLLFSPLPRYS
jgi:hypothetical protein